MDPVGPGPGPPVGGPPLMPPQPPVDYVKIGVLSLIVALTIAGNVAVVLSILVRRAKVRNVRQLAQSQERKKSNF